MTAKIITYGTQKGGTGKSTSVVHAADCLHKEGFKVLILDTDEQATIANMEKKRSLMLMEEAAEGAEFTFPSIQMLTSKQPYREFIAKVKDRFDYIFIDTKGEFNQFQFDLIRLSDFVICPIAPSELDLNPTILVHEAVEHENSQRKDSENQIGMAYCISKAEGSNTLKHVVHLIKEKTGRPVIEPYIRKADPIAACTGIGFTVFDAAQNFKEVKALVNSERQADAQTTFDSEKVEALSKELKEMTYKLKELIDGK